MYMYFSLQSESGHHVTRCPTPTFTVRKILTSLLANTVHVFTAVYMIECARHDPPLFIEGFAGKIALSM